MLRQTRQAAQNVYAFKISNSLKITLQSETLVGYNSVSIANYWFLLLFEIMVDVCPFLHF